MNVNKNKKAMVKAEPLFQYDTVRELFKILYNIAKMLNAEQYFDYCYCNLTRTQCWLCKFSGYVKFNDVKTDLLRYRKNENELVDIACGFLFYLKKIKTDKVDLCELKYILEFFNGKFNCGPLTFDEVIKNDIAKYRMSF